MRRAVIGLATLVLAAASCRGEDTHLARARTLMATDQWANARTALGRALKADPQDTTVRGLLLYALEREDGLEQIAELSRYSLFQFVTLPQAAGWDRTPAALRTFVEERGRRFFESTSVQEIRGVHRVGARHRLLGVLARCWRELRAGAREQYASRVAQRIELDAGGTPCAAPRSPRTKVAAEIAAWLAARPN